jgi:hypothetical protein
LGPSVFGLHLFLILFGLFRFDRLGYRLFSPGDGHRPSDWRRFSTNLFWRWLRLLKWLRFLTVRDSLLDWLLLNYLRLRLLLLWW